jgi:hypothetical protein
MDADYFVLVKRTALLKMHYLIALSSIEVGWLGTVTREGNVFTVHDVFLVEQECHASTTELDPKAQARLVEHLLATLGPNEGIAAANALCLWGHSHVNMGTSPSHQDDQQMSQFADTPFAVRAIGNKSGRLEFSIWDFEHALIVTDVPWLQDDHIDLELRDALAAEIKEKVREVHVMGFDKSKEGKGKKHKHKHSHVSFPTVPDSVLGSQDLSDVDDTFTDDDPEYGDPNSWFRNWTRRQL